MNRNSDKSDSRVFYRNVFALVVPMALQNLINVAVTSADVMMLGQTGETVLSASSLAGQVQFIMTLFFFGLTSGAAILTAQYWGKGDTRTIEKVMGIALRFSLCTGLVFALAAFLIPAQLMRIFTPEEDVIAEGVKYLRIIAVSYVPMALTNIYLNIMRSVERVVVSTVTYLVSLVTNIALNAVFIFGLLGFPAMGIQGAALATVCARLVELVIVLVYSKKINRTVRLSVRDIFVRDPLLFRDFLTYSVPVMINELLWGAGAAMNSVVIGHLGSAAVAANSVTQVARQLATVVAFGIANATAIMIGKAIGAGDTKRAEEYGGRFIRLTLVFGLIGGGIVLISRPILMSVMTLSAQAQDYLSFMMFVMSYFVIAQAMNTTLIVGVFRAGGDAKIGLIFDVGSMWFGSILLGSIAAFVLHLSLPVVYVLLMSDELIKIPLSLWRYRKKIWLKNITR